MTKVKLLSWNATAKEVKLKSGSEVQILNATSSLFARMLVIARSSREDIDLETVIGTHEFAYTNRMLLQPDGSTYPTTDKSTVIHMLDHYWGQHTRGGRHSNDSACCRSGKIRI